MKKIPIVLLLAGAWLLPTDVVRAESDPKGEAREAYRRAMAHAEAERYAEAAQEFGRAYELSPHYSVLYNMGKVYSTLGRSVEAIEAYERFLSEGGSTISAERRSEVAAQISTELTKVSWLSLTVSPAGALVLVDGKPVGASPFATPLRMNSGEHTLTVTLAGHTPAERVLSLTAGKRETLTLALEPVANAAATGTVSEKQRDARVPPVVVTPQPAPHWSDAALRRRASLQRTVGYAVAAAGAAGIAVGSYFLIVTLDKQSKYDAICPSGTGCSRQDLKRSDELSGEIYTSSTIAGAFLSAGGVALLSGVALVLLTPNASPKVQSNVVRPIVGESFAGATWSGRW